MRLIPQLVRQWPKLAWVATFREGTREVRVLHGPMVEVAENWIVEGVWAGEYRSGDFDRTDLVFGSGVRCREDRVTFVTAGTAMDRLWHCRRDGQWHVSNSFGALSAVARLSLREDHRYVADSQSDIRTTWGLSCCTRDIPTDDGDASFIWFNNLVYDGRALREVEKPDSAPCFGVFGDYRGFLRENARAMGRNLRSPARRHEVLPMATVSSGYDSPAAAVIAAEAGCRHAVSIRQSTSLWRGSDSGRAIAEGLGMSCRECDRTARSYPHEAAFWAPSGWCNLLNWTLFPYPASTCLLFQGNYGDAIWDRKGLPSPFMIDIWDDLGMGEFRLIVGMFQCPVPFWGMRHAEEINRIASSREMEPWTIHTRYDRPIARRIVEEAGIPRGSFAVRKKDSSHEAAFKWPYSPDSQASFRRYLTQRGYFAPTGRAAGLLRRLARLESLLYQNVLLKARLRVRFKPWERLAGAGLLFHWANEELTNMYQAGLAEFTKAADRQPRDDEASSCKVYADALK